MAIYATPAKSTTLLRRLDELDELRRYLAQHLGDSAEPWTGALRRLAAAEATVGSTSIEGYGASIEDTVEILAGRRPAGASDETQRIIAAYAQAMDRVAVLADDPRFQWSGQTILDLHFLVCHPQPEAGPGRLREGPVIVTRGLGRDPYRPPASSEVPTLVNQAARWLESGDLSRHPVIRAAMAHLNLVSIHPFRDGNGRLARIVQSLVLAKEGLLRPELVSIEPYLGRHTREYYAVLEEVQGLAYDPHRDASAWVEFCIEAHVFEATERRRWLEIAYARHYFCSRLARENGYPERFVIALDQALLGLPVTNSDYRGEAAIAGPTATQDLQRLRREGWLGQEGGGRSLRYVATRRLQESWSVSRDMSSRQPLVAKR
ncbi:MAG TPA: Fic family protein [Candidatus Dormibacteraeota bacterium]|nr:Fic family protein [Candidatus Dormibacteraeota bacterium]